jgi:hypothetical protein
MGTRVNSYHYLLETLRAGKLGTAQRALVLQMIEHAERVLQTLPTQPDEPRQAPQSEEPDARAAP